MSRWTRPSSWRVLETERRLVGEKAGVGDRQRPLRLDQPGEVEPFDVLHREDDALADPGGVVGRDDVRVPQFGDGPDLAEEAVENAGAFHDLPPHHLEHLVAAHQRVVGEVDHPHPAPAEFPPDLVIGLVGQARREGIGPGRGGDVSALLAPRDAGQKWVGRQRARALLRIPDPAEETVGRHLGDPIAAGGAILQVPIDRLGLTVVELAQPVRTEGLVCGVRGPGGVHRAVSGDGSRDSSQDREAGPASDLSRKHKITLKGRRLPPSIA